MTARAAIGFSGRKTDYAIGLAEAESLRRAELRRHRPHAR